jgi:general secretion pathway protein H
MSATGEIAGRADEGDRGAQAGTTLVEALVVVAITSLVAMVGFPRLQQGLLRMAQRETVALVAAQLRRARADAQRLDRPTLFAIAPNGQSYQTSDGQVARTPPGVEVTVQAGGGQSIAFFADGSSSGGRLWVSAARLAVPIIVAPIGVMTVGGR